jgi:hypothetical protein
VTLSDRAKGPDHATDPTYHGRPIRRLANEHLWLDVLAAAGPRIVRLGLAGSTQNLLAETPDAGWETPTGRYELFGGHRLWFAPEDPDRVAVPDGSGLRVDVEPDGIRLTGATEQPTGLVRSMAVRLMAGHAGVEVCHELRNTGDRPFQLAPWPISQLPLGGTVLLPQAAATVGHALHPNRTLVLWPYTSWEDPRLRPRDGMVLLDASAGPSLKVGCFNDAGWVGYVRDGAVLIRRFEPQPGRLHPDLGCNVEVYIGDRFVELELLGPLAELPPSGSVTLVERWEIEAVDLAGGEHGLRDLVGRLGGGPAIGSTAA